jgi:hypothetical protein
MPQILKYYLQISLYYGLFAQSTLQFGKIPQKIHSVFGKVPVFTSFFYKSSQIHSKSTLQNSEYLKKYSTYTLKALKSTLNIQKSSKKQLKARGKLSFYVLFPLLTGLFLIFDNTVTVLLAQFHYITKSLN